MFDVYEGAHVKASRKSMAVDARTLAADHTLSGDELLGVLDAVTVVATDQLSEAPR